MITPASRTALSVGVAARVPQHTSKVENATCLAREMENSKPTSLSRGLFTRSKARGYLRASRDIA